MADSLLILARTHQQDAMVVFNALECLWFVMVKQHQSLSTDDHLHHRHHHRVINDGLSDRQMINASLLLSSKVCAPHNQCAIGQ
jgi:hypothetical protein